MRIAVYSRQPEGLKRLTEQLSTDKRVSHLRVIPVDTQSVDESAWQTIDVLIFDELIGDWITPGELERLSKAYPDVFIMLLTRQDSGSLFIDAVSAGVRSILRWPATPAEIDHALAQCLDRLSRHGTRYQGKTLAFIGAKGGSGSTFVALNLGYVWATRLDKRVLLVDLDLQYGDASFGLGETQHPSNVVQVTQDENLDEVYLESACVQLRRNLFLLPSPLSLEEGRRLAPVRLEKMLVLAARLFDVVIIDLPAQIDDTTIRCMEHCNQVLQIVSPTVTDLRNQQRQLRYLHELGIPVAKVGTIINRMPRDERRRRNVDPFAAEIVRHLSGSNLGTLPRDNETAALALGAGESVVTVSPDSSLSQGLIALAHSLLGLSPAESPARVGWRRWLNWSGR